MITDDDIIREAWNMYPEKNVDGYHLRIGFIRGFQTAIKNVEQRVVEFRNIAHINCIEEKKQAFNMVINYLETQ